MAGRSKTQWGRGGLLCAGLQVISGWFHSDEKLVPFEMLAGSGRPASRKDLIQQLEVSDFIRLHQDPVEKGTATGAANLIRQQFVSADIKDPQNCRFCRWDRRWPRARDTRMRRRGTWANVDASGDLAMTDSRDG